MGVVTSAAAKGATLTYPPCRLCRTRDAASAEHVVLNALGGRRTVGGFLCGACNNTLGAHIDAPLEEALRPISILINALRGDGDPVAPLRRLETADGLRIALHAGARPEGAPGAPLTFPVSSDGKQHISVSAATPQRAADLLYHGCRKLGVGVEALKAVKSQQVALPVGIG